MRASTGVIRGSKKKSNLNQSSSTLGNSDGFVDDDDGFVVGDDEMGEEEDDEFLLADDNEDVEAEIETDGPVNKVEVCYFILPTRVSLNLRRLYSWTREPSSSRFCERAVKR
jgi:hypothetical protein